MWNGAPVLEHAVGELERLAKRLGLRVRAVARRVHVREVDHRAHPAGAAADLDAVLQRAEVADAAHHLDPERNSSALPDESLAHERELLDDRVDRVLTAATEQEPGVEHDDLGAARRRDPRAPVERTEGRATTSARSPRGVPPSRRAARARTARRRAPVRARRAARPTGSPSRSPTRSRSRRRRTRAASRSSIAVSGLSRSGMCAGPSRIRPIRRLYGTEASAAFVRPTGFVPSKHGSPTRIDLLELDIDLRLTELWREAADVSEWSLEVVSAFMRAAYGKGYCDALTEDAPGSLCLEHGYDVPRRRERDAARG